MGALNVEQYKKQISGVFVRWSRKIADCAEMLGKIQKQIARLEEQLECATPEGEKKFKAEIEEFKKARQKIVKQIEAADMSLRVELMLIEPPEKTKSNEKEFLKLPGFIQKLVDDEGVALGKTGVILKPDVDFDFKAGKLEKFGIELKFKW
jgi:hypothetical protein